MVVKSKDQTWWDKVIKNWGFIFLIIVLLGLTTGWALGKYTAENYLALTGVAITNTLLLMNGIKEWKKK